MGASGLNKPGHTGLITNANSKLHFFIGRSKHVIVLKSDIFR